MAKKGGRIGRGNNRNQNTPVNKGNSTRVPQQGPLTPNNAPQQSLTFDTNPHKFTRPTLPQPPQQGSRKNKNRAA
ncbi:MAG TPA: hypothetical protein DCS07_09840 [Bdellovibrionales bacterium]|nr:MAG: hypothetical protein A2Z97_00395 [Bdellovibrionales bacterium GWB1_52_6]OFZ03229.1 MAG: hypothetical protein A2X97_09885 [Bdellovibrionales bacterium GWA1_52_35]OFZ38243.1 MAG: hypothetical protein A2070_05040 [Bdellovibrionales bacterium GWC1_52_8]HAR42913.1 hypothetical protein [Bdellovibrionales bacterium]HCM40590.1 hypothetical protein [Bdellovibrionales bacterium]